MARMGAAVAVCPICEFWPPVAHSIYCRLCGMHLLHKPEAAARAVAMINAKAENGRGFLCYYTGHLLELEDATDPWYVNFDHRTPGKKGDLAMCAWWINDMKGPLDEEEFWAVVLAYADHLDGKPFPPEIVRFKYWKATAEPPGPRRSLLEMPLGTSAEFCEICGDRPAPRAKYCPRCGRIVYHAGENLARVAALKRAWNEKLHAFVCRYTGLVLNDTDINSPLYINFDHVIPGKKGRLEAVAAFINRMKTAMTKREFDRVMRELARFRREGGTFNGDVVRFRHWARLAMVRAKKGNRTAGSEGFKSRKSFLAR